MRVPVFKDEMMEGKPAIYLGRLVSKENFRAYIYAADGVQKLVESWEEFESHMQTGLWFSSLDDLSPKDAVIAPTVSKLRKFKKEAVVLEAEEPEEDKHKGLAFEV